MDSIKLTEIRKTTCDNLKSNKISECNKCCKYKICLLGEIRKEKN